MKLFSLSFRGREAVGVLFKLLIDKTSNSSHIAQPYNFTPLPTAKPLPLSLILLDKRSSLIPDHFHQKPWTHWLSSSWSWCGLSDGTSFDHGILLFPSWVPPWLQVLRKVYFLVKAVWGWKRKAYVWLVNAEIWEAQKLHLENNAPNPSETSSLKQGCLGQDRQFPTIGPLVIFLNSYKYLISLNQINRGLFIHF